MTYCKHCDREVGGVTPFSWPSFIFWSIISVGILGFIYAAYCMLRPDRCPICNMGL